MLCCRRPRASRPWQLQSSVFIMPSVSMGNAGISLTDHLLLPGVPTIGDPTHSELKDGSISSLASPFQLFGKPQVAAPQFFLTGNQTGSLPDQQLLIPVSTGNGTKQFISIPVSMATGGNQLIQLISTSNGQIVATNLSNLALNNPLWATLTNTVNSLASQSLLQNSSAAGQALSNQLAAALAAGAQNQLLANLGQQETQTEVECPWLCCYCGAQFVTGADCDQHEVTEHATDDDFLLSNLM